MSIFRRLADGYSEILPAWKGETVVILGAGPSLTREQCEFVRGARVIAINNAYLLAPWADVLWFDGDRWLNTFKNGDRAEFKAFRGEFVTLEPRPQRWEERAHVLRNLGVEGLSSEPSGVYNGRSSGYAAINAAALAGAARIVLLGMDYRTVDGRDHFPGGDHPIATADATWSALAKHFRALNGLLKDRGIECVNATPGSRLEEFPRVPLDLVRWFDERAAA